MQSSICLSPHKWCDCLTQCHLEILYSFFKEAFGTRVLSVFDVFACTLSRGSENFAFVFGLDHWLQLFWIQWLLLYGAYYIESKIHTCIFKVIFDRELGPNCLIECLCSNIETSRIQILTSKPSFISFHFNFIVGSFKRCTGQTKFIILVS